MWSGHEQSDTNLNTIPSKSNANYCQSLLRGEEIPACFRCSCNESRSHSLLRPRSRPRSRSPSLGAYRLCFLRFSSTEMAIVPAIAAARSRWECCSISFYGGGASAPQPIGPGTFPRKGPATPTPESLKAFFFALSSSPSFTSGQAAGWAERFELTLVFLHPMRQAEMGGVFHDCQLVPQHSCVSPTRGAFFCIHCPMHRRFAVFIGRRGGESGHVRRGTATGECLIVIGPRDRHTSGRRLSRMLQDCERFPACRLALWRARPLPGSAQFEARPERQL